MTIRRLAGLAIAAASALLILAGPAMASGKGTKAAMVIDAVQFKDLQGSKKNIEILGAGFDNGAFPVVTLNGEIDLDVLSATAAEVSVNVPANVPDGDYSLMISTGGTKKQNADFDIHLGGSIHIVCVAWYLTTGPDNHIHVEAFLQDENGDPVIGAAVSWESFVDGRKWYDYSTTTFKYAGYNHGESCPISVARESGATGQNCCVGNATDPPDDSRSCEPGWYEIDVISVTAPPGSDRVWDGVTPDNGREFVQP